MVAVAIAVSPPGSAQAVSSSWSGFLPAAIARPCARQARSLRPHGPSLPLPKPWLPPARASRCRSRASTAEQAHRRLASQGRIEVAQQAADDVTGADVDEARDAMALMQGLHRGG